MIWFQSPNVEVETFVYVSIHLLEELIYYNRTFTVYVQYTVL